MSVVIACSASKETGLGHYSRMMALRKALISGGKNDVQFILGGQAHHVSKLFSLQNVIVCGDSSSFFKKISSIIDQKLIKVVVLDLHKSFETKSLNNFLTLCYQNNVNVVAVDSLIDYHQYLTYIWIPSIYFNPKINETNEISCEYSYGWDHFLIEKKSQLTCWNPGNNLLVLTGGGDVLNLGSWLPDMLDKRLNPSTKIHWIQGPFAAKPKIPKNSRLKWAIKFNPTDIHHYIRRSNYVLTLFGVSFFEVLQYGIPTVVSSAKSGENIMELKAIRDAGVALTASDPKDSIDRLIDLMSNDTMAAEMSLKSKKKMSIDGSDSLASKIFKLME